MVKTYAWAKTLILIGGCLLLCVWFILQHGGEVKIDNIDEEAFHQEILESDVPVLVIFCDDELWNRTKLSTLFSLKQVCPSVLAIKELNRREEYKGKVKFLRYAEATRSNLLCKEFNINWFPTVLIFKNSEIFWRGEGGGCTKEESIKAIEKQLKMIL